jgi:hypothetical protein
VRVRLLLLIAAIFVAPASALANPKDGPYVGPAQQDLATRVKFDVSRGTVDGLNLSHLAFTCRRRPDTRRNPPALHGPVSIRDGAFRGRLVNATPTRTFAATIAGHLLERGGARGWLRYSLTFPNGDRCTAIPAPLDWTATNRDLRFASGFGGTVSVEPPVAVDGNWRFPIVGADRGYDWQTDLPGHTPNAFFPIVPESEPVDSYADTAIESVHGPQGTPTRALLQEVLQDGEFYPHQRVRNQFRLIDPGRRGAASYWIKLQPDLEKLMPPGRRTWRFLMELRGASGHPNDYRMSIGLLRQRKGPIRWEVAGRRLLPRYAEDWTILKKRPPVPIGKWFRLNASWLISRRHGYLRVSVDGHRIIDHEGRTRLEEPIDSIQILKVYTGAFSLHRGPAYQWVDDVEIRRGLLSPPALRPPAPARR